MSGPSPLFLESDMPRLSKLWSEIQERQDGQPDTYQRFKPKRTLYRGQWFESNLEARTAEAFDSLGIPWEYESVCTRDRRYRGGQYTPDFHLPNEDTYVEVVGRIDQRHADNAEVFCETMGVDIGSWGHIIGSPHYFFVTGNGIVYLPVTDGTHFLLTRNVMMGKCRACGKLFVIDGEGLWACPHCGGDHSKYHYSGGNLFEFADGATNA